jgi:nucleotide-binding universal stress UspA family protein
MSPNFEKILSPIQFNDENSLGALDFARQLAMANRGRVFLLHVIPEGMVKPDLPGYQDLFADEGKALEVLKRIATSHLSDCPYQVLVKSGDPAEVIKLTAEQIGADLIVMATHGRRGLAHFMLGSVADKVVREAPCLVMTVRPDLPAEKK